MRETVQGTQTHKYIHSKILRNEWKDGWNEERMTDVSKLFLIFMKNLLSLLRYVTQMTIMLAYYWPTAERFHYQQTKQNSDICGSHQEYHGNKQPYGAISGNIFLMALEVYTSSATFGCPLSRSITWQWSSKQNISDSTEWARFWVKIKYLYQKTDATNKHQSD